MWCVCVCVCVPGQLRFGALIRWAVALDSKGGTSQSLEWSIIEGPITQMNECDVHGQWGSCSFLDVFSLLVGYEDSRLHMMGTYLDLSPMNCGCLAVGLSTTLSIGTRNPRSQCSAAARQACPAGGVGRV